MRMVCAWCQTGLRGEGDGEDERLSHGICAGCAQFMRENTRQTIPEFIDRLDTPIFLVDGDGVMLTANTAARKALGKELPHIEFKRGGEVIECAHSRLPGAAVKLSIVQPVRSVRQSYSPIPPARARNRSPPSRRFSMTALPSERADSSSPPARAPMACYCA